MEIYLGPDVRKNVATEQPEQLDDDDWVAYNIPIATKTKTNDKTDPCEEDWDNEIEQETQYNKVIETCNERRYKNSSAIDAFQNSINRYPPAQQAFSGTAQYDSFVYKSVTQQILPTRSQRFVPAVGQFDDAD